LKLLRVDTKVIMGSFLLVLSSLLALLLPLILKGLIDGSSIENIGSKVFQSYWSSLVFFYWLLSV
ncbi:TPA: hypothetical protein ACL6ML_001334, partial [Streptococcus pneumoniae]